MKNTAKNFMFYVAFVASLGGLLFGFDTAVISGAEKSIQVVYDLSDFSHGFTIAIALIGTIIGAFVCSKPVEKHGRLGPGPPRRLRPQQPHSPRPADRRTAAPAAPAHPPRSVFVSSTITGKSIAQDCEFIMENFISPCVGNRPPFPAAAACCVTGPIDQWAPEL